MKTLGKNGPVTFDIGLGCMGMSGSYGPADEAESIATIHAALEAGITLLDTGDFYGMGHNEMLVAKALAGRRRENVQLSVKFGALRDPGGAWVGVDTSPRSLKAFLAYSLRRLNTDYIDIYRPSRLDPSVPIEETVGAIAEMVGKGYVRAIGLSEVGAATIRRAHKVHPISDLQIEYSLLSRGIEAEILPTCRELGISVTAYGVLSRGLIGGGLSQGNVFAPGDFRTMAPRFSTENLQKNTELVSRLQDIANAKHLNVAQVAIAWVLSQGKDIIPLIGAKRKKHLQEAIDVLRVQFTSEELAAIARVVPAGSVSGDRYPTPQMANLDSERKSG